MDRDVKSPALKRLQGLIWEGGYRTGELKGQVFPDVPPAFAALARRAGDDRHLLVGQRAGAAAAVRRHARRAT